MAALCQGYTSNGLYAGIYSIDDALKVSADCGPDKKSRFVAVYDQDAEIELYQQRIQDGVQLIGNLKNEIESLRIEVDNTKWWEGKKNRAESEVSEVTAGLLKDLHHEMIILREALTEAISTINKTRDEFN